MPLDDPPCLINQANHFYIFLVEGSNIHGGSNIYGVDEIYTVSLHILGSLVISIFLSLSEGRKRKKYAVEGLLNIDRIRFQSRINLIDHNV